MIVYATYMVIIKYLFWKEYLKVFHACVTVSSFQPVKKVVMYIIKVACSFWAINIFEQMFNVKKIFTNNIFT